MRTSGGLLQIPQLILKSKMGKATQVVLLACGLLMGRAGDAQVASSASPAAPGADSTRECPYDACALRQEGTRLLRGREGKRVASVGFFRTADVARIVVESDSAHSYALAFLQQHRRSTLLGAGALALLGVALVQLTDDAVRQRLEPRPLAWVGLGCGMALAIPETVFENRAMRALSKAIWWYNRGLPRGSPTVKGVAGAGIGCAFRDQLAVELPLSMTISRCTEMAIEIAHFGREVEGGS